MNNSDLPVVGSVAAAVDLSARLRVFDFDGSLANASRDTWAVLEPEVRFMRALERAGKLDRAVEFLPDEEVIAEREAKGVGFSRPEISVLLAYSKMTLYESLLKTDLPEDPYFAADLVTYFPSALRKKFVKSIGTHSLRREIVATQIANSIVNRAGMTFVNDVIEDTEISAADIARAYVATRDAFDLRALWADIAKLDNKVDASLQTEMMIAVENLIRHAAMWFLKNVPQVNKKQNHL